MTEWFPDLYRYRRTALVKQKLIAGIALLTLICLVSYQAVTIEAGAGAAAARGFFYLQAFFWMIIAPAQSVSSISVEREQRTWDFQRLTPLTSFQALVGKLLGAPSFTYLLGFCILPWSGLVALKAGIVGDWLFWEVALLGLTILANALGVLASANVAVPHGRANLIAGPLLGSFLLLFSASYFFGSPLNSATTTFYGVLCFEHILLLVFVYLFAAWAFLGAKWQIGRDFLEKPQAWRWPAYLIFVAICVTGIPGEVGVSRDLSFALAVLVYGASGAQTFEDTLTIGEWIRLVKRNFTAGLQLTPIWIAGWVTFAVICIGLSFQYSLILFLPVLLFLLRDLTLQESARYLRFKHARIFMLVLSLSLYVLPLLFNKAFPWVWAVFIPVTWQELEAQSNYVLNIISALIQVVITSSVLVFFERRAGAKSSVS